MKACHYGNPLLARQMSFLLHRVVHAIMESFPGGVPTKAPVAFLEGVTPAFVKNCTLRPEFTRGIVLYPVDWTDAGQVLDLIKAALQKLRRCGYFRLAA